MHELGITTEIIAIVTRQAQGRKITKVVLEIGKVSGILADSVRFCFEMCCQGTVAEGASLEILEPPGRARCRSCGHEIELDQPFGQCGCGNVDLELLSGAELTIKEIEVLECALPADAPTQPEPN